MLLPVVALIYETYNTQVVVSPEYLGRFTMFPILAGNMHWRGRKRRTFEIMSYWGENLWFWQHWVRRSLIYIITSLAGAYVFVNYY